MRRSLHFAFCAVLAGVITSSVAQDGWSVRQIASNDGLPQNSIIDMAMDSLGYLWVTTEGGLVRYDGQIFRRFDLPSGRKLRSERVRDLIPTAKGELVVTDAHANVYALPDQGRTLPLATFDIPTRRSRGGIPSVQIYLAIMNSRHPVAGYFEWRWEYLWMFPFDEHRWAVAGNTDMLWYRDTMLVGRTALPKGVAWFMLHGDHILALDSNGSCSSARYMDQVFAPVTSHGQPFRADTEQQRIDLFSHLGDSVGVLLYGDAFFLMHPDPEHGIVRYEALNAPMPYAGKLNEVQWAPQYQMLVLGSDMSGLYICQRTGLRSRRVTPDAFHTRNTYYAQIMVDSSTVIALTTDAHAIRFDASTAMVYDASMPITNPSIAVNMSNGGSLYAAKSYIMRLDPSTGRSVLVAKAPEHIMGMFVERDTIWVATHRQIGIVVNGKYQCLFGPTPEFGREGIFFIRRGPDGLPWFGAPSGLYRLLPGSWKKEAVPGLEGFAVRALTTIKGHTFIGTYGDGAFVLEKGVARALPRAASDHDAHVHAFMLDSAGYFWRSTNHGLFRCAMKEVEAWIADPSKPIYQEHIGKYAGIRNVEFNGGCEPAFVRLPNGVASFPSMDGLVQFKPEEVPVFLPLMHVLFERVVVNGLDVQATEHISVGPGVQSLKLGFATAYWGDPANLQMEYKLAGWDDTWHPLAPDQRELEFTNLPPADYTLRIRMAGMPYASEEELPDLAFTVRKPWYAATWAIAVYAVLALGLVALIVRAYARRLEHRNMALEHAVQERTASLMEANAALERSVETKMRLVSIITHDIVAPLRFIARAAGGANERPSDDDGGTLRDIAHASEKLHSNARNLLSWVKQQEGRIELRPTHVAMNPFIDEVFAHVSSQAASKGIQLINQTRLDDVLLVDRDLLGIVLNNLVTNALTHTERGSVTITGGFQRATYQLIVGDTGSGFNARAMARLERIRLGEPPTRLGNIVGEELHGLGYVIVTDLLRILHADFEVLSDQRNGTNVLIALPVPR